MNNQDSEYPERSGGCGGALSIAIPNLRGTVTLWVMAACVATYVGLALLNVLGVWPRWASYSMLGLSREQLSLGMVWQAVTSPFLHFSVSHLLFNMLALAFLGARVERRLGKRGYVVLSLACALAGSAGFLLLGSARAIGAGYSSVIYGVMVACAVFWPDRIIYVFYFFPMKMKWAMLLMALTLVFLNVEPSTDAVAHAAHLGGAVAGFIYIKLWHQQQKRRPSVAVADRQVSRPRRRSRKRKQTPPIRVPDEL
jgi:membrane associated rhomboid family serine protease